MIAAIPDIATTRECQKMLMMRKMTFTIPDQIYLTYTQKKISIGTFSALNPPTNQVNLRSNAKFIEI